jgi:glycine betaine/proline transport system permease protein
MGRLDVGKALIGGVGIVILAVVLDRVTQGLGRTVRQRGARHWYLQGPAGMAVKLARQLRGKKAPPA